MMTTVNRAHSLRWLLVGCITLTTIAASIRCQQWQLLSPSTSPPARNSHALAFDVARGVQVMFGGYAGDTNPPLGDTWEWNGTDWTQRAPAASPPPRWGHHLAYDSRRMRVVLFGGYVPNGPVGVFANDTWEYDGTTWTQRTVATRPAGRGYGAMAYDSARGVTVLFGGYDWPSSYFADTWEWDGAAWTQRSLPASPSGRRGTAMAFDSTRGQMVTFGGGDATTTYGETWTYDGMAWTQRAPASTPNARWEGRMTFDAARGRAVLHGGADATYATNYGDTWDWDGTNWTQASGVGPSGRHGSAMAFDGRRGQVFLSGGRNSGGFVGDAWAMPSPGQNLGRAIRLGPSTVIQFPFNPMMHTGSASTMEYWLRADSPRGDTWWARYQGFAEHKTLGVGGDGSVVYLYAGSPWHQYPYYGGVTLPGAGTVLADGQWHHLAFVRRASGSWSIYVDGSRIINEGPGGGLGNGCWLTCGVIEAATITQIGNGSPILWSWDIDLLRVSNVERYSGNFTPLTSMAPDGNTAMLLNFDEGAGSSITDSSSANQLGTFFAAGVAPTWQWTSGVGPVAAAATIATYGQGCAHSTNTPALGALNNSTPRIGQVLSLRLSGLPQPTIFTPLGFVGFGNTTALGLPLPFSMGLYGMPTNCQQYVEPNPSLMFTLVNSGGFADWNLALPNNPQLLGQEFFTQGLVFDWTLPFPLPAVSTNAAIATIGL